jgi:hypothetical protein
VKRPLLVVPAFLIVAFGANILSPQVTQVAGSWAVVPSPNTGSPNNHLFGVAAVAPDDVWAVGAYGVLGVAARQLIEHWDGTKWRRSASPSLTTPNELLGVSAVDTDDVWAGRSFP